VRQSVYSESEERELLQGCREMIQQHSGQLPRGWLSPWISESLLTPDLLSETGYQYNLNWCHDDQPTQMQTRSGETIFKRVTAWAFYRLMRSFVHADLPVDAGDFRLISRECLEALKGMRETHRFLRGMVAWVGFAQIPVFYKRDARAAGETKYPLSKMLKFAWTAALSFSPLPLRASLVLGLVTALVGFLAGLYALVVAFIHFFVKDANMPYSSGWASIMTITCLVGGAILISVGVLGEYIARIYDEIKARPLYLVSHRRNLDHPLSR
ncbi:hypothetical protein EBR21_08660, partial [bacterium]|nr:hypothetical protein [bacterium]